MGKRADSKCRGCEFESRTCRNKNTIGEEGNGKAPHEIQFASKELRALSMASAKLEIEYAVQREDNQTSS